jgi:hypothetical protein
VTDSTCSRHFFQPLPRNKEGASRTPQYIIPGYMCSQHTILMHFPIKLATAIGLRLVSRRSDLRVIDLAYMNLTVHLSSSADPQSFYLLSEVGCPGHGLLFFVARSASGVSLLHCRTCLDFPVVVGSHLWQVDQLCRYLEYHSGQESINRMTTPAILSEFEKTVFQDVD